MTAIINRIGIRLDVYVTENREICKHRKELTRKIYKKNINSGERIERQNRKSLYLDKMGGEDVYILKIP